MSTTYPGQNTEFFVVIDGQPKGPFTGLRAVFELNITPDTPVWYQGMGYWTPAAIDEVTRQLFDPSSEFYRANPDALDIMVARTNGTATPNRPDPSRLPDPPAHGGNSPGAGSPEPRVASAFERPVTATVIVNQPEPKSYLVGSILIMLFMSLPAGIVALIYSLKTRSAKRVGDLANAARASEISQLWIVIGIVLGLIWIVAWPLISSAFI